MHPADDSREDGHSATDTRSATKQSAVIFDEFVELVDKPSSVVSDYLSTPNFTIWL